MIINLNLALNLMNVGIFMYSQTKTVIEQITYKTVHCSTDNTLTLYLVQTRLSLSSFML